MATSVLMETTTLTALTLADDTGLLVTRNIDGAQENGVIVKDMWSCYSFTGHTTGEGNLLYGLSRNVGSVNQLKEWLQANPSGPANVAEMKFADSDVFVMGYLQGMHKVTDGYPMQRMRWPWKKMGEDDEVQFWLFNQSGASLTTGLVIKLSTIMNVLWMDD